VHPVQLFQNGYNDIHVVDSRHFGCVLSHKKCINYFYLYFKELNYEKIFRRKNNNLSYSHFYCSNV